jgi:ATP-binding cassette subfamily B (MDR/TAP) protein 1
LEVASENVVRELKTDSLEALIKQEIAFFDEEDSSSGNLTSKVSTHPANVGAASGLVTAQVIVTLTILVSSALLSLILEWRAAIVCLTPVLVLFFTVSSVTSTRGPFADLGSCRAG